MIPEIYFSEYNIKFDPFTDITFKEACDARNSNRKELQALPEKRKASSVAIDKKDIHKMAKYWNIHQIRGITQEILLYSFL